MSTTEGSGLRMGGLTPGRIVHWREVDEEGDKRCEAAIVTLVDAASGNAHLRAFRPDGGDRWVDDASFDPSGSVGTFHEAPSCPFQRPGT